MPARCEWCGVKNVLTGMPPVLPHASCGALLYKDSACAISWLVPQASVQVSGELAIETQCGQGRRGMVRGTARAHPQQHRAPAGLGARASAPFVGSEANELYEQEMGKLHRRAPQGVSAGDGSTKKCPVLRCKSPQRSVLPSFTDHARIRLFGSYYISHEP